MVVEKTLGEILAETSAVTPKGPDKVNIAVRDPEAGRASRARCGKLRAAELPESLGENLRLARRTLVVF